MDKDRILKEYLDSWLSRRIKSWEFSLRRKGYWSTRDADRFKWIIQHYSEFSIINKLKKDSKYSEYITKIETFISVAKEKSQIKNKSFGEGYDEIIKKVIDVIQPTILQEQKRFKANTISKWESLSSELQKIGYQEFNAKYGTPAKGHRGGVYYQENATTQFAKMTKNGMIALADKQNESYKQGEEMKVSKLFFKLKQKYSKITRFEYTSHRVSSGTHEFNIKGYDSDNNEYSITTTTIGAGGYNIQRYHYRWLMQVIDFNGKKIKLTQN